MQQFISKVHNFIDLYRDNALKQQQQKKKKPTPLCSVRWKSVREYLNNMSTISTRSACSKQVSTTFQV